MILLNDPSLSLQAHKLLVILLNPPLLLHDLELISNFVLSEASLCGLIFDIPLVPLINGAVECFIF